MVTRRGLLAAAAGAALAPLGGCLGAEDDGGDGDDTADNGQTPTGDDGATLPGTRGSR